MREHNLIKELGIEIKAPENEMLAYQNGFTESHRAFNVQAKEFLDDVERELKSGQINREQALAKVQAYQRAMRNHIEKNPKTLLGRKSDPKAKTEQTTSNHNVAGEHGTSGKKDDWP